MNSVMLPSSIAELRQALAQGQFSVEESLHAQRQALSTDPFHCVASLLQPRDSIPSSALPLAGVGLAHKDIFNLNERIPYCGTEQPWVQPDPQPAIVIERLERAGATQLGALTMAEYACGATGENAHAPLPLNPIDAHATVGGSSSGSAVAVAGGMVYGSLGTDTAGSVRIPAATCGVLGLKPSNGLLPTQGTAPLASSLDTIGIIARCADDIDSIFYQALSATQQLALNDQRRTASHKAWGEWSIAVCWRQPDPVVQTDDALIDQLISVACASSRNGHMASVSIAERINELTRLAQTILYVEASVLHMDALNGASDRKLSPLTRNVALAGATIPVAWYRQALTWREKHLARFMDDILSGCDLLLTPCLPAGIPDWKDVLTTSPDFKPRLLVGMFAWTAFVNYLGLPAIVLPVSRDGRGRPIALQAIAGPGKEAWLIEFARQVEAQYFDRHGFASPAPYSTKSIS